MTSADLTSQWQRLLLNLGAWQGSFTRFSPQGELQSDVQTLVTLEGLNDNQTIRQTIQYSSSPGLGQPTSEQSASEQALSSQAAVSQPLSDKQPQNRVLEYSSLGRSILFFAEGAFSQGSMQLAPFTEFGAEIGFIQGDRRLRLVQLFGTDGRLSMLTLIREHRQQTPAAERPLLSVERLLGTWQGEAVTIYPDWRTPDRASTTLHISQEGNLLHQHLTSASLELSSTAQIDGSILRFAQSNCPRQVLLLPDGASSNTPIELPRGKPFFLEAGWLVADNLRQRMIRSYDTHGGWTSLTLVTEHRS